jgi:hypothetical protein
VLGVNRPVVDRGVDGGSADTVDHHVIDSPVVGGCRLGITGLEPEVQVKGLARHVAGQVDLLRIRVRDLGQRVNVDRAAAGVDIHVTGWVGVNVISQINKEITIKAQSNQVTTRRVNAVTGGSGLKEGVGGSPVLGANRRIIAGTK